MDEGSSPHRSFFSRLVKLFKKGSLSQSSFEDEISDLLDHGAESGIIPQSASEMIQSIVEFNDTVARQIMTPRIDMVGVEQGCSIGEVINVLLEDGYSRLPVYDGDMDHISGFIVGKDLLQFWGRDLATPLPSSIIRPIILVPGNKKIGDVLSELRHQKSHLAIVLDEYGGTAGLVTMEDIIEEIVGDIHDEYDEEEAAPFTELSPGVTLATGQAAISDLSEHLGVDLPEGDYDTLGGFLTNQVGRVPQVKEEILWEDLLFSIIAADDRKVEQVEIRQLSLEEQPPEAEEALAENG
ncbi:HlyC/CorC family transporter [Deltaproteobacteria bacterium Smac51]|nr:HlyC/CorC family transporter [Deltaproteobacteria bacterium Smac51]